MLRLIKTGKRIGPEGTTIYYRVPGHPIEIESRKRHIPHSNRSGTWDYTSYFVLKNGEEVKEMNTLRDAKEYVEEMLKEG